MLTVKPQNSSPDWARLRAPGLRANTDTTRYATTTPATAEISQPGKYTPPTFTVGAHASGPIMKIG